MSSWLRSDSPAAYFLQNHIPPADASLPFSGPRLRQTKVHEPAHNRSSTPEADSSYTEYTLFYLHPDNKAHAGPIKNNKQRMLSLLSGRHPIQPLQYLPYAR